MKNIVDRNKQKSDKVNFLINNFKFLDDVDSFPVFLIKNFNKISLAKAVILSQCLREEHPV